MLNDDFNEEKHRITKDELRELSGVNYDDQTAEAVIDSLQQLSRIFLKTLMNKENE